MVVLWRELGSVGESLSIIPFVQMAQPTGPMNVEAQDEHERSSRGVGWEWLCWLGVLLLLYVLSSGPVVMVVTKNHGGPVWWVIGIIYQPLRWAAEKTPLAKPLGMYWHLWAPEWYDGQGNSLPKYE